MSIVAPIAAGVAAFTVVVGAILVGVALVEGAVWVIRRAASRGPKRAGGAK